LVNQSLPLADPLPTHTGPAQAGPLSWLRQHSQVIAGLLVSAWSIWLLAQTVDPREVGRHLAAANWLLLTLCFLSIFASMVIKAHRCRLLFERRDGVSLEPLVSSLYIGYLMNTVLPARVGEFVRAYLAGRLPGLSVPMVLATIVLEKILDLLTLGLLLGALLLLGQVPYLPPWLQVSVVTTAVGMACGVLALAVMLALRRQVLALVAFVEARVPLLSRLHPTDLASSFLDGLVALGRRDRLPGISFWSVAAWASSALTMWLGLTGVGIDPSAAAVLFTLVVSNIGMAVPSAPGYVGVFHFLLGEALQPYGIDANHALAAAIVMHPIVFGNFVIGGIWYLWRGGHSLGNLRRASGH
jgi:uncharacterized protein (TIRG00374 family)